jgi:hypothetical protein
MKNDHSKDCDSKCCRTRYSDRSCKSDHERAVRNGRRLSTRLGKGWRVHVWQNIWWFWAAVSKCGRWKIHPCLFDNNGKVLSYTAYLGAPDSPGGPFAQSATTPEEAIALVRKEAQAALKDLKMIVEGA